MHTLADLAGNKTICVVSMIEKLNQRGAVRQRRLPNLAVLRAFEATVRYGSVSKAAKSQRHRRRRQPRGARIRADPGIRAVSTHQPHGASDAAGARAGERDRPGLDNLQSAIDRACRHHQNRPLVISCEPTFLIRWLIPRLAGLQQAVGKERDLQLVSAGGAVAFSREGIDLAIRRNDFPIADDVVARPFLKERVGPVCRREHAATGRELRGTLLHTETRPHAWRDWCAHSGIEIRPGNELRFEHFYLSLQAAVAGAGIGIGPLALVADDIVNGALVAPYGFAPDGTDYVLMTQADGQDDAIFSTVLAWLVAMGEETERAMLASEGKA